MRLSIVLPDLDHNLGVDGSRVSARHPTWAYHVLCRRPVIELPAVWIGTLAVRAISQDRRFDGCLVPSFEHDKLLSALTAAIRLVLPSEPFPRY